MFESWVADEESGIGPSYRELFMQQEQALREVMQTKPPGNATTEINPTLKIYDEEMLDESEK